MNELTQCQHGIDGMHIANTIFGFDCNACLLDMVAMVERTVETNIDNRYKLPQLGEEEVS